mmetsp:Transcript_2440/g.5517  ORF Transcript_2440/g.5517 Transcript_2440/m.5517 type:complete len:215 (-) Transcript_2440:301-945(-)
MPMRICWRPFDSSKTVTWPSLSSSMTSKNTWRSSWASCGCVLVASMHTALNLSQVMTPSPSRSTRRKRFLVERVGELEQPVTFMVSLNSLISTVPSLFASSTENMLQTSDLSRSGRSSYLASPVWNASAARDLVQASPTSCAQTSPFCRARRSRPAICTRRTKSLRSISFETRDTLRTSSSSFSSSMELRRVSLRSSTGVIPKRKIGHSAQARK